MPFALDLKGSTRVFIEFILFFWPSSDRNPFYSHVSASIQGLTTIRAYKAEGRFRHQFHVYQDEHTASWFLFLAASRWLGSRLDFMCTVFITLAAFTPLLMAEGGIS